MTGCVRGFSPIGPAPRSLEIAGRRRDHLLFQRLADDPRTVSG
jgi:RimJ/RimL family protein N-acetyltransferase